MIPRIIHYCWVSDANMPLSIKNCIKSWHRHLPDFTLRLWDGNSFDWTSVPFVHQALQAKKYAFVADYIRLYALYTEGGIYLDSDVEVLQSIQPLLDNSLFFGTEAYRIGDTTHYRIEPAIMGAESGHPFLKQLMAHYEQASFKMDGNAVRSPVMPEVVTTMVERLGYCRSDVEQILDGSVHIYPTAIFSNELVSNRQPSTLAVHHNTGSWMDVSYRGPLYRLCHRMGWTSLYHSFEHITSPRHS